MSTNWCEENTSRCNTEKINYLVWWFFSWYYCSNRLSHIVGILVNIYHWYFIRASPMLLTWWVSNLFALHFLVFDQVDNVLLHLKASLWRNNHLEQVSDLWVNPWSWRFLQSFIQDVYNNTKSVWLRHSSDQFAVFCLYSHSFSSTEMKLSIRYCIINLIFSWFVSTLNANVSNSQQRSKRKIQAWRNIWCTVIWIVPPRPWNHGCSVSKQLAPSNDETSDRQWWTPTYQDKVEIALNCAHDFIVHVQDQSLRGRCWSMFPFGFCIMRNFLMILNIVLPHGLWSKMTK